MFVKGRLNLEGDRTNLQIQADQSDLFTATLTQFEASTWCEG